MTHISVSEMVIIGWGNDLSSVWRHTINSINDDFSSIGPRGPISSEIEIEKKNPTEYVFIQAKSILKCHFRNSGHFVWAHDDVIKWNYFPRNWPFVRGIHRSPVNSPHKGQWRGALMFSSICARINGWANNGEAGDLRRYRVHCDVIVMFNALARMDYNRLPLLIAESVLLDVTQFWFHSNLNSILISSLLLTGGFAKRHVPANNPICMTMPIKQTKKRIAMLRVNAMIMVGIVLFVRLYACWVVIIVFCHQNVGYLLFQIV